MVKKNHKNAKIWEESICKQIEILYLLKVLLSILLNKIPCMTLRKERIWQIQLWNTWEKQVQSGAKEVFPPPWWILDSNGISPMLGHLYNTSWLQVCTLWTVNDVSGKDLLERPPKRSVVADTKKKYRYLKCTAISISILNVTCNPHL